jgi:hypothetical protein
VAGFGDLAVGVLVALVGYVLKPHPIWPLERRE